MSQYDKRGTFTLFPNKDRKTDKHPNSSGTLILEDGTEYFIEDRKSTRLNSSH